MAKFFAPTITKTPPEPWKEWYAWYPVRLLTWEWAWRRTVWRRPAQSGMFSFGKWDYCNPI